MYAEVMEHFGLFKDFASAGYFETRDHEPMFRDLKNYVLSGTLVALTGPIGVGKTRLLRHFTHAIRAEGAMRVVTSLAIDKNKVNLQTLIDAIAVCLVEDEDSIRLNKRQEYRMRQLQRLIARCNVPVVLFVDEAHDIPMQTLVELKRLMEVISDADGQLSIVLVGHPRLRVELTRASMQEIGMRTRHIAMKGIEGQEREFFEWMVSSCAKPGVGVRDIFTAGAIDFLTAKLKTPLEMACYTGRVLSEAFVAGQTPVSEETARDVIGRSFDSLEARLTRQGYPVPRLAECLNTPVPEIRSFIKGRLSANRLQEIEEELELLGVSIAARG